MIGLYQAILITNRYKNIVYPQQTYEWFVCSLESPPSSECWPLRKGWPHPWELGPNQIDRSQCLSCFQAAQLPSISAIPSPFAILESPWSPTSICMELVFTLFTESLTSSWHSKLRQARNYSSCSCFRLSESNIQTRQLPRYILFAFYTFFYKDTSLCLTFGIRFSFQQIKV